MEVLFRRRCCAWCNTEATTPPQPLHKRGRHGGGRPLRNRLNLICCISITCLVLAHGPRVLLTLAYSLCFDVSIGSSVDHASGEVGGVLASFTTMVKVYCGSSFLIIPPWCLHTLRQMKSVTKHIYRPAGLHRKLCLILLH